MAEWDAFYNREFSIKDYLANLNVHGELFEEIIRSNPRNILELGIGSGIMGIFLSWLGYEVIGADNDTQILEKAKLLSNRLGGKVKYIFADAFKIDEVFGRNQFDLIFSNGLLEHFDDTKIRELVEKQLIIGTEIVISIPSKYDLSRAFGNERYLRIAEWEKILRKFNPLFLKYYGNYLPSRKELLRSIIKPHFFPKFIWGTILKSKTYILIKIKKL